MLLTIYRGSVLRTCVCPDRHAIKHQSLHLVKCKDIDSRQDKYRHKDQRKRPGRTERFFLQFLSEHEYVPREANRSGFEFPTQSLMSYVIGDEILHHCQFQFLIGAMGIIL